MKDKKTIPLNTYEFCRVEYPDLIKDDTLQFPINEELLNAIKDWEPPITEVHIVGGGVRVICGDFTIYTGHQGAIDILGKEAFNEALRKSGL